MKIVPEIACPDHGRKWKPEICENCAVIVKYFRESR